MKYCKHCGKALEIEVKFCSYCGTKCKVRNFNQVNVNVQNDIFSNANYNKVCKCHACGEILNPMDIKCPSCGYEIRSNGNALKEFKMKIETLEREKIRSITTGYKNEQVRIALNEQMISLINNFVIPMNKEDVYEILMIAKNNSTIKYPSYASEEERNSIARVIRAWKIKYDNAAKIANGIFTPEEYRRIFNKRI